MQPKTSSFGRPSLRTFNKPPFAAHLFKGDRFWGDGKKGDLLWKGCYVTWPLKWQQINLSHIEWTCTGKCIYIYIEAVWLHKYFKEWSVLFCFLLMNVLWWNLWIVQNPIEKDLPQLEKPKNRTRPTKCAYRIPLTKLVLWISPKPYSW